jgi:hypothetical protein
MARLAYVALAALALSAAHAQNYDQQCFDEYLCIFHYLKPGTALDYKYSWDFRSLCRAANQEYTYTVKNFTYRWNICGTVAKRCVPQEYPVYVSEGVATQQWSADPPCPQPPAPPGCEDPETKQPVCCTGDCTVLAHDIPRYQLLDSNNPTTGGIIITHAGMPPE